MRVLVIMGLLIGEQPVLSGKKIKELLGGLAFVIAVRNPF